MALITELCPKCSEPCDNDSDNVQTDNRIIFTFACDCGCEFEREYTPGRVEITKEPD